MKLRWTKAAKRDLDGVFKRLAAVDVGLAEDTIDRIGRRMTLVQAHPESCPLLSDGVTRRCGVAGTGYLVYYRLLEGAIVVDAVFHHRQDRPM